MIEPQKVKPAWIPIKCPNCLGYKTVSWGKKNCPTCDGTGYIKVPPADDERSNNGNENSTH